ncbi:MAG: chromate efflux transporter [Akkermansiaceae bacterium]|jgi:chromate transporter|nr:chromate efflux transporter [Akkermansiaceae bacterium]
MAEESLEPQQIGKPQAPTMPGFADAVRYWFKLGCISFGGPAGQIAIMHKELVEKRRWISNDHFLHALNFCMLLPGPEAQQLATYLGWRLHGAKGGIAAGALFVIPSIFILFGLSWLFMAGGHLPWLKALFYGLNAAVIAVVAEAVIRIGRKSLRSPSLWAMAALSFVLIFFFKVSFVFIILGAALIGWLGNRMLPAQFPAGKAHGAAAPDDGPVLDLPPVRPASWGRSAMILSVCLILWWLPVFAVASWLGWGSTAAQQGLFFSKAALVTFGGAYAVLPYVAQQAVEKYGWLSHGQMMSGLGLAETTPGPLIMVLQFVGFVGGWQFPGSLSPLGGAAVGALLTTWVTFMPCFLFVFLGAPHIEKLQDQPRISAALSAITAAVVGVILNLAVKFTLHAVKPESAGAYDGYIAAVAIAAFVALWRFKVGLMPTIGVCALLGLAGKLLLGF